MMNEKIKIKLEEFENKRNALLEEAESLGEVKINERPIEGKWSILEIIEHLVVAEREVLGNLPEYEAINEEDQSFKNGIMFRIVMAVLKIGIPVKVPTKKMLPKNELSLSEIRKQWDESQKWFRGYVDKLDETGLKKAVFSHPVAGPINVEQAIKMSIAHIDSHTKQIKRRLELIE